MNYIAATEILKCWSPYSFRSAIEELTEKIEEVKAGDEELEEAGEAEADAEADADAAEETEAESCSICPEPADPAEGEDKDGRAEE